MLVTSEHSAELAYGASQGEFLGVALMARDFCVYVENHWPNQRIKAVATGLSESRLRIGAYNQERHPRWPSRLPALESMVRLRGWMGDASAMLGVASRGRQRCPRPERPLGQGRDVPAQGDSRRRQPRPARRQAGCTRSVGMGEVPGSELRLSRDMVCLGLQRQEPRVLHPRAPASRSPDLSRELGLPCSE
jgi:hypothetical protein